MPAHAQGGKAVKNSPRARISGFGETLKLWIVFLWPNPNAQGVRQRRVCRGAGLGRRRA